MHLNRVQGAELMTLRGFNKGMVIASALFLCTLLYAQIFEKRADDLFFEDGFTAGTDRIRQFRRPTSGERFRFEGHHSGCGMVIFDVHAPGNGCVLAYEVINDMQASPIKVGVAA